MRTSKMWSILLSALFATVYYIPVNASTNINWTPAGQLTQGHILKTADGKIIKVLSINKKPGTRLMYNLSINQNHNFFLDAQRNSVLVHNCDDRDGILAQTDEEYASLLISQVPKQVKDSQSQAIELNIMSRNAGSPEVYTKNQIGDMGTGIELERTARAQKYSWLKHFEAPWEDGQVAPGNCFEFAMCGVQILRRYGYPRRIDILHLIKKGNHAFIGLNMDSDNPMIVDTWRGTYFRMKFADRFLYHYNPPKNAIAIGLSFERIKEIYPFGAISI